MTAVKAQVAASGVSAPPEAMPGLLEVVNQAHADGINLKIVLLDHNPPNDTPLRDIATVVGADYPDATVLTLSPSLRRQLQHALRAGHARGRRGHRQDGQPGGTPRSTFWLLSTTRTSHLSEFGISEAATLSRAFLSIEQRLYVHRITVTIIISSLFI